MNREEPGDTDRNLEVRELTLLFHNLNLAPRASVNIHVTADPGGRLRARTDQGVPVQPVVVQSTPRHVLRLAARLRSPAGLASTEARIVRAYQLGQEFQRIPAGEDRFPEGDLRPHLSSACWVAHGIGGDWSGVPGILLSFSEIAEALGPLQSSTCVLGFASQAEAEACVIGAGSSYAISLEEGRAWRRTRQM